MLSISSSHSQKIIESQESVTSLKKGGLFVNKLLWLCHSRLHKPFLIGMDGLLSVSVCLNTLNTFLTTLFSTFLLLRNVSRRSFCFAEVLLYFGAFENVEGSLKWTRHAI